MADALSQQSVGRPTRPGAHGVGRIERGKRKTFV
jgi:hypothetical protein